MKALVIPFGLFALGFLFILIGGADGTWESMSTLSWTGLVIMNLGIGSSIIIGLINLIRGK